MLAEHGFVSSGCTQMHCSVHLKCTGGGNVQSRGVQCSSGIGYLLSLVMGRNQISEKRLFPFVLSANFYLPAEDIL